MVALTLIIVVVSKDHVGLSSRRQKSPQQPTWKAPLQCRSRNADFTRSALAITVELRLQAELCQSDQTVFVIRRISGQSRFVRVVQLQFANEEIVE
jgi:pimeloyl-CoA synthetase